MDQLAPSSFDSQITTFPSDVSLPEPRRKDVNSLPLESCNSEGNEQTRNGPSLDAESNTEPRSMVFMRVVPVCGFRAGLITD